MSSESSDDENLNFLKEAQDSQFLNDSMFSGELDNSTSNRKENIQKSLRKSAVDDEHHHYNSLKAQIKESLDIQCPVVIPKRKRKHGGVKLFASSQKFLKLDDECEKVQNSELHRISKPVPFRGRKTDINIDALKEVTVSGEDILSHKETKNWSDRTKSQVFNYKKNIEGTLELIEPVFK